MAAVGEEVGSGRGDDSVTDGDGEVPAGLQAGSGTRGRRLAWTVAVIALAPILGVPPGFTVGLGLQLAAILAALAFAWSWAPSPRGEALRAMPVPIRVGLGLYAAGALWGVAVGIVSGNPLRYVASQGIAMLLLPLAAAVFVAAALPREQLLGGLAVATVAGLVIHVAVLFVPALTAPEGGTRFLLRNGVAVTGIGPMVVLLFLGWGLARGRWWRFAVVACATLLVLGSMARGAWMVTMVFGAVLVLVLPSPRRWLGVAGGVGLLLAVAASWGLGGRVWSSAPDLTLDAPGAAGMGTASEPVEVAPQGSDDGWLVAAEAKPCDGVRAVDVRWRARGDSGRSLQLVVAFQSAGGRPLQQLVYALPGSGRWRTYEVVVGAPGDAATVSVVFLVASGSPPWSLRQVSARTLDSRPAVALRRMRVRLDQLLRTLRSPRGDGTLDYRAREWRAVRGRWERAGPGRLAAGHGLGAVVPFANSSFDEAGRRVTVPTASYLHNFYVFLAFKLGAMGVVALAGLLIVAGWTGVLGVRRARSGDDGWFELSAAAAWAAYLVWSVSSPEIYDFRLAPLWGALVAAVCIGAGRPERPG